MKAEDLQQPAGSIQLLDVRLADDFEAIHLEGAASNCVYEVQFEDRLADTAPDKSVTTVVYGANRDSQEAAMAAEKLERLDYTKVEILEGGIVAAKNILPLVEGEPLPAAPAAPDGTHTLDLEQSRVGWTGRNLINKHHGSIAIRSGELEFTDGQLTGGSVVLDPKQLVCDDLDGELHDVLIAHLQSHDFFDTGVHPEIRIEITGSDGELVQANLTIKGITHPIEIPIASGLTPEGLPAAQGTVAIDRTKWNVLYGSKRFFHRLAGHLVNDLIEIELRIVAGRGASQAP
ncbi:MAG: YceI family protein [Verrucomicrobiota bacterium]